MAATRKTRVPMEEQMRLTNECFAKSPERLPGNGILIYLSGIGESNRRRDPKRRLSPLPESFS